MAVDAVTEAGSKLRIKVTSNLAPREFARALSAVACEHGVEDAVEKALKHSTVENYIPEAALREILDRAKRQYGSQWTRLRDNIMRWLEAVRKSGQRLTDDQIEELRLIIRAHFQGVTNETRYLWSKYRLQDVHATFTVDAVQDAYLLGRLADPTNLNQLDISYEQLVRMAHARPLSELDRAAIDASRRNTRLYLRKLHEGIEADAYGTISRVEAAKISGLINQYMDGTLAQTRHSPVGLDSLSEQQREALATNRMAHSETDLRSELYHYFKDDPQQRSRDWWRVAITETRAATNIGRMVSIQTGGFTEFYFLVQPDACKLCKRTYLNPDGTPRIFVIADVLGHALSTHGVNVVPEHQGLPNAVLHPHCNCVPFAKIYNLPPISLGVMEEVRAVS